MTETPYTDDDLRTEAGLALSALVHLPTVEEIATSLRNSYVPHLHADGDEATWGDLLDHAGLTEAARQIHELMIPAAPVGEWAVRLGADGLVPSTEHTLGVDLDGRPAARIHFAYAPDMPAEARTALVEAIDAALTDSEAASPETDEQRTDRLETERDHTRGDHTHCGLDCEVEMPTEHLRNFVIAKGYPGTKGALDELIRRARAEAAAPPAPAGRITLNRDQLAALLAHHADVIAARWRESPGRGAWVAASALDSHAADLTADEETPAVRKLLDSMLSFETEHPAALSAPVDRDRIAQAIAADDGHPWDTLSTDTQQHYRDNADAVLAVLPAPADRAAVLHEAESEAERQLATVQRVRHVLESELVLNRTALEYRGLIIAALMADEAQQTEHPPESP
ncbi:hypothetical protein [Streptomyces sp. Je 1-369]|uniref:hypothetical protein n=1 Tax=Streptomyces sp. Je 1-369 TaxID=2966192 RepID=UPI002286490F|nr:hypothetical protein [Streptomyces sp. Je 1-369]WAL93947.1 hypothetical protein NOO62_05210 [Streptomyces sp. Je 1-369]